MTDIMIPVAPGEDFAEGVKSDNGDAVHETKSPGEVVRTTDLTRLSVRFEPPTPRTSPPSRFKKRIRWIARFVFHNVVCALMWTLITVVVVKNVFGPFDVSFTTIMIGFMVFPSSVYAYRMAKTGRLKDEDG